VKGVHVQQEPDFESFVFFFKNVEDYLYCKKLVINRKTPGHCAFQIRKSVKSYYYAHQCKTYLRFFLSMQTQCLMFDDVTCHELQ